MTAGCNIFDKLTYVGTYNAETPLPNHYTSPEKGRKKRIRICMGFVFGS